jgi:mannose-6-phosphate isomerase-like protein (cupin superfamily)
MFAVQLEKNTLANQAYRRVLFTTEQQQLVLMHLLKGQEIGNEKHKKATQFIRVEKGSIQVIQNQGLENEKIYTLKAGDSVTIPSLTMHNVVALKDTKLYTIYAPKQHPEGLVQELKP